MNTVTEFLQKLRDFAEKEMEFATAEQVDGTYSDYWEGQENAYRQIIEKVDAFSILNSHGEDVI